MIMNSNSYFNSANMNYIFNVEYFENAKDSMINKLNKDIENFEFPKINMFEELMDAKEYKSFILYTTYPGLLMGSGNLHDISCKGAFKLGFSFDYVNGLSYLAGSSLKGILRSVFPEQQKEDKKEYCSYLNGLIGGNEKSEQELIELEHEIFDYADVFLGAYPDNKVNNESVYLASDFITPHKPLKNPNPISFVKIKPGIGFKFHFLLKDGHNMSAEDKCYLFKRLILDLGVGAKTNIGYGKFEEKMNNQF